MFHWANLQPQPCLLSNLRFEVPTSYYPSSVFGYVTSFKCINGYVTFFSALLLWLQVFRPRTPPEAIELVSRLLEYTPSSRISPMEACAHPFFNELRHPGSRLPNGRDFPPLFNFTPQGERQGEPRDVEIRSRHAFLRVHWVLSWGCALVGKLELQLSGCALIGIHLVCSN